MQTVRNCSHITGFDAVHGVIILALIGSCLSAAGGIVMVAQILDPTNLRVVVSACTLYAMSLLLHWVSRLVYFASVVKSMGYSIITANVRRDLLESQKKYTKKKYCKYNDFNKCSKGKHILRRGFERRYCSIPIDV